MIVYGDSHDSKELYLCYMTNDTACLPILCYMGKAALTLVIHSYGSGTIWNGPRPVFLTVMLVIEYLSSLNYSGASWIQKNHIDTH